jgi:large subunit ribosomal protein L23
MKDPSQIIVRPLLTEKSTLGQRLNKFTFEVDQDATKIDIRHAVETLGRCQVEKVNTLNVKGKLRRGRRGKPGRTSDWKKAVVTLREGEVLGGVLGQAFEGV